MQGIARDLILVPVDKDIPIPEAKATFSRKYSWPWQDMQIGDSFLMPGETKMGGQVSSRTKIDGRKYTSRIVSDGVRVWRIE